jgi:hypothetical protein
MRLALPTAALAATLLAGIAAPAGAQNSVIVSVTVTAEPAGEPVQGARVTLDDGRHATISNERGEAVLRRVAPGRYTLEVQRIGFTVRRTTIDVTGAGLAVPVSLASDPVEVAAVEVEAPEWGRRQLDTQGFYERKRTELGTFFTREDIVRENPRSLAHLLRRFTRMRVQSADFSRTAPVSGRSYYRPNTRGCVPMIFLDGVQAEGFDLDNLDPENVEGLEVYKGASEVPPAFNRSAGLCGAVLIWTRVH